MLFKSDLKEAKSKSSMELPIKQIKSRERQLNQDVRASIEQPEKLDYYDSHDGADILDQSDTDFMKEIEGQYANDPIDEPEQPQQPNQQHRETDSTRTQARPPPLAHAL